MKSDNPPRFIIIGAGSRGINYAQAISQLPNGVVAAVAEPQKYKRERLGQDHIWGPSSSPKEGQSFSHWKDFVAYERTRRRRAAAGEADVPDGVDGAFVCVLDSMHRDVVVGLAPLGIHIMCEKPLAASLADCLDMYAVLKPVGAVFSIGHVLRYTPHNMLLRKLLVDDRAIGEVSSVVHTEPVGWWHFAHSYVRGNWRRLDTSAPSLLTKCCHDIDLMLWLLSPAAQLPSTVSSTGGLYHFRKERKPGAAGAATNCTRCPLGDEGCKYSAKRIYLGGDHKGVETGNTGWPLSVLVNDIEDLPSTEGRKTALTAVLEEDWDAATPKHEVASRSWFGRCVYESDNDVCDEQTVTIAWPTLTATVHMVAHTKKLCNRYSNFYGAEGEIYADSEVIVVENFNTGERKTYTPGEVAGGHGGGDVGLTRQFVSACDRVKNHGWEPARAQAEYVGCTLEDVLRSHAMVFAAEDARVNGTVIRWDEWWDEAITKRLGSGLQFR